ncbi:hypothetical protein M1N47_04290, partial [Dehalococcoidia bacterium]|nr:hypothetical protein [Dehalococcoidia bacterium]
MPLLTSIGITQEAAIFSPSRRSIILSPLPLMLLDIPKYAGFAVLLKSSVTPDLDPRLLALVERSFPSIMLDYVVWLYYTSLDRQLRTGATCVIYLLTESNNFGGSPMKVYLVQHGESK